MQIVLFYLALVLRLVPETDLPQLQDEERKIIKQTLSNYTQDQGGVAGNRNQLVYIVNASRNALNYMNYIRLQILFQ